MPFGWCGAGTPAASEEWQGSISDEYEDGATKMTHYRLWRDGWLLVAAFSTGFGLLVWPWTGVALYPALATAGAATVLLVRQPPPRWRERLEAAPYPWRRLAGRAGRIGLGTVGFVVVSATMPALVLGLAVLVVLTSPWLASRGPSRRRGRLMTCFPSNPGCLSRGVRRWRCLRCRLP